MKVIGTVRICPRQNVLHYESLRLVANFKSLRSVLTQLNSEKYHTSEYIEVICLDLGCYEADRSQL